MLNYIYGEIYRLMEDMEKKDDEQITIPDLTRKRLTFLLLKHVKVTVALFESTCRRRF